MDGSDNFFEILIELCNLACKASSLTENLFPQ